MPPPNTLRYCEVCKKNTIFSYVKDIGHSRCRICGQGFSSPVKDQLEITRYKESLIRLLNLRIVKLSKQPGTCDRRNEINNLIALIKKQDGEKDD
jgi:hypothetical protein